MLATPATTERARPSTVGIFCLIWFGIYFNQGILIYLLPLTIHKLTPNAFVIACVLALNPVFGFIAQPLVGVLSDRIWTPLGRRTFFIIVSAPIIALCAVLIPNAGILWQLVPLVLLFDFFHSIVVGSDHPLLADLVPPEQRMSVMGWILIAMELGSISMLFFGLHFLQNRFGDASVYWAAAGVQLAFVMTPAFFLKEKKAVPHPDRPKLSVKRYINDLWGNSTLRRFAFAYFAGSMLENTVRSFISLFAVYTLLVTKARFGGEWTLTHWVAIVGALPAGILIEKYLPKHRALAGGIVIEMMGCAYGLIATGIGDLAVMAVLFGTGFVIRNVTIKPFFTEYIDPDIIGQVGGALNIFYAVGRTLTLLAGGAIIKMCGNDYRVIWYYGLAAGVIALIITLRIPDLRFEQRRAARTSRD